jgi:tetratricopeptide (TPR) repeat protein
MKKAVLVLMVVFVAALALAAQDYKGKARQGGVVLDEKGAPLEGVTVKLFSVKAQQGFEVKTDANGKWMGAWIRSGGWTITFEKVGYAPQNVSINVQESAKNPDVKAVMVKVEGLALTEDIKKLLIEGNAAFEQQKFDEALASYMQIIAKYPDAYIIYRNIGNCYFSQEKYDLAEEAYLKVLEKAPNDTDAIIAVGNCYSNRGDSAKALEWYGKVEFEKIDDPVVLYNMGTNYYNNNKFEDALKFYQKAVEKQKESPDALFQLGLTYLNLQKNMESIAAFEDYLKIDPDSPRAAQVKALIEYLKKK